MKYLRAVFLLLGMLGCASLGAVEVSDTRILYINSYHRGYSWSDGIEDGLRERLAESGRKIELSIEYLDSRRFAYGAQIEPLAQAMAAKYANYRPELIVVSDNAAFDFTIQQRGRLFPGLPIVFCGYNNFRPNVIKGIANITGVNEEIAVADTVAMALTVHPRTRTLAFVISTGDASSKRIGEIAEMTVFPELRKRFDVVVLKDVTLEQLRQRLAALPASTLLFLSGQVADQGVGRALTPAENGSLITAVSPFPTYTFWDFHLNRGVIGGHIIAGREQGRTAADMALRILEGTPADDIPVVMKTPTRDIFDFTVMERFGITPASLPRDAVVINQPYSLWETHRWEIIGVISLVVVETLFIGLLLHVARGRRNALASLAEERSQLEQRVVERTQELKEANAELERLSLTDSLTGLANRRRFDQVLEIEFARLGRSGAPLSLIILDIDHFKTFNDLYGHVAGDDCLRRIGGLISGMVNRAADLAARYGGEEIAFILPETDLSGAVLLAERLRTGIAGMAIPHAASDVAEHVTASLGVLTISPAKLQNATEAVRLVDMQLYRAKAQGRNQVISLDARE